MKWAREESPCPAVERLVLISGHDLIARVVNELRDKADKIENLDNYSMWPGNWQAVCSLRQMADRLYAMAAAEWFQ